MKNVIKRLTTIILGLTITLATVISPITISAKLASPVLVPSNCQGEDTKIGDDAAYENPLLWYQGDSRWSGWSLNGGSVGPVGCLLTSIAKAIKLSGMMEEKYQPMHFYKCGTSLGAYSGGGLANYGVAGQLTNGEFFYVGKKSSQGTLTELFTQAGISTNSNCGDFVNGDAQVKCLLDAGFWVILNVSYVGGEQEGHFVLCVGVDEETGKFIIADTFDSETTHYNDRDDLRLLDGTYIEHVSNWHAYATKDPDYAFNSGKIIDGVATKKAKEESASNGITVTDLMNFYGEEEFLEACELNLLNPVDERNLTLLDNKSLNVDERMALEDWKGNLDYNKETKLTAFPRTVFMILGILVILYALTLVVAYCFDWVNSGRVIDIELLEIVSAKRLKFVAEAKEVKKAQGVFFCDLKRILIIAGFLIAIAVLILTGRIYLWVSNLLELLDKLFSKIF